MDCPLYSPVPLDCWSKNRPLFCFCGDLQSSKSWHLTYCLFPCRSVCLPAGKACQRRKIIYWFVFRFRENSLSLCKHWNIYYTKNTFTFPSPDFYFILFFTPALYFNPPITCRFRGMWLLPAHSLNWYPPPSWAPAAVSCHFRWTLPPKRCRWRSSSGHGTGKGCYCRPGWGGSRRDCFCFSFTASLDSHTTDQRCKALI